jgi:ABC-type branched-subunit amino acid transport system substrate-binding protein
MTTTGEHTGAGGSTPTHRPGPRPGRGRVLRRYLPIVVVLAIGVAVAVRLGGGGGEEGGSAGSDATGGFGEALVRSGPMTPQKAKLEGKDDIDFGPDCDTATGRIKLPVIVAPPCVVPFAGDNGGATSPGVTADEVRIVYYQTDPKRDPLGAASLGQTGVDIDAGAAEQAVDDYARLYNKVFETYGRTVVVETFTGSSSSSDIEAARADALAIADKHPFAVIGGPAQATEAFAPAIASRGIVCGPGCSGAPPEDEIARYAPYLWSIGPTPDQGSKLAAEMVAKLAGPGPAEFAGDAGTRAKPRSYAVVHYDTDEGQQARPFRELRSGLAREGITLRTDIEFHLDLARMQDNARTIIAKLRSAGVTTVIFTGDPLTPAALTKEATAQNYHPEWILGPNVLADSTVFARSFDQEQWSHGFGMALLPARGDFSTDDAVRVYRWAYGKQPPTTNVTVLEPFVRQMFAGIHLAGPKLTPETLRDAFFRAPVAGGTPTVPKVSAGRHGIWPGVDWGGSDDMALLWWDPNATGKDEIGHGGKGMYRFAQGGERYTLRHLPSSLAAAGVFDDATSVMIYKTLPPEDRPPDYPPPS